MTNIQSERIIELHFLKAEIMLFGRKTWMFNNYRHHKSTQTMWNSLQVLYNGTEDIKDSKINMLTEDYEHFGMEPGESISSMQTRFLHLINKLENLGKTFSNKNYANKILRYVCMKKNLKVPSIKYQMILALWISQKFLESLPNMRLN